MTCFTRGSDRFFRAELTGAAVGGSRLKESPIVLASLMLCLFLFFQAIRGR